MSLPPTKKVMISSTARDLPDHREMIKNACLRQSMLPLMMEHLPANSDNAIKASLTMVNEADLYLGVFAYRYGYIPEGYDLSITEMEYNRAVERGIPCLIFMMHDDHPITGADSEKGTGAVKIEALKDRMKKAHVINFFKSPAELLAFAIDSLSDYRRSDLTAFHSMSEIPTPPAAYIAHPYVLLQTPNVFGRQAELNLLTDWVTRSNSDLFQARLLSLVAIGGMGKSALAWKWFNDIAPYEMQPLAGRLWWSFYESNASIENFVICALAYVSRRSREDIRKLPASDREEQLLSILDHEPFLLVLDGLERLLIAYARMDAAHLLDDDLEQVRDGKSTLPQSALSFPGQYRLHKAADLRTGAFLRKLTTVHSARILVSTRLYPADLQTETGSERIGCRAITLQGLVDDDALNLWRALGISGSRETLIPLFHTIDNHPLFIQVLAGEIAHDRRAPRDFETWRKNHPAFNPFHMPLIQVKSHILEYALHGLDEITQRVLYTIAAFRMPATYDTLVALFVGTGKPCTSENGLGALLTDLEDRGLLGWDRRANRYDLHPIVRGVTWNALGSQTRHSIYQTLRTHFESLPTIEDWQMVENLEDLTSVIELYSTLVGLGRYDEAFSLFNDRLRNALHYRLSASRQRIELLEMLFPDGLDQLPRLRTPSDQAYALNLLAVSQGDAGKIGQATILSHRSIDIMGKIRNQRNMGTWLRYLSYFLRLSGRLHGSEVAARQAVGSAQRSGNQLHETICLSVLGVTLAVRGMQAESSKALDQSIELAHENNAHIPYDFKAMCALWFGDYRDAQRWAERAMTYSQQLSLEQVMIRATRLQGEAALGLDDRGEAEDWLHLALMRSRGVNLLAEELPALIGQAELQRRQGHLKAARELLDDVWEPADGGQFLLFCADAYNVLAQIERDSGDHTAAAKAATMAYALAWCDGPPFAYHHGLQKAKAHLTALNVQEPILPPFEASSQ